MNESLKHLYALLWAVQVPEAINHPDLVKQVRKLPPLLAQTSTNEAVLLAVAEIVARHTFLQTAYDTCLQALQQQAVSLDDLPMLTLANSRNLPPRKTNTYQKNLNRGNQLDNISTVIDAVKIRVDESPSDSEQSWYQDMVALLKKQLQL